MIQKDSRRTPVLFTVHQVANKLSCSEKSVWRYIELGILPSVRIGHNVRVTKSNLLKLMRKGLQLPDNYYEILENNKKQREEERIKRNAEYNKLKGGEI